MKELTARRWAEGTWKIPVWTDEMKHKRAATMRAKALGNAKITRSGKKTYRQVLTADGYRYEHRVLMEKTLGRKLERWEQVHHINEDGLDNRPENLELLAIGQHTSRHHKLPEGKWSRKFAACVACGGTNRRHAAFGLCRRCYQKPGATSASRGNYESSGPQA